MKTRIPIKMFGVRATLELKLRLNKEDIAEKLRSGTDVELLQRDIQAELLSITALVEKVVVNDEQ